MLNGSGELSNAAEIRAALESIKVLGICLEGTDELGYTLQTVLRPVGNLEISLEIMSGKVDGYFLSRLLARIQPNIIVLCLRHGEMAGVEHVFGAVRKDQRELSIVAVLDSAAPDQLHQLINSGAADFCLGPLRLEDLLPRILRWSSSVTKSNTVVSQLERSLGLQQFLGRSPLFLGAVKKIPKYAQCDASVVITGETGTGKEMCARAIHHLGPRADHAFVPVNCGAIPSELVENELFGHEAGAFTGASSTVRGLVHEAEGGTLFLDEIDSLPVQTQVKFLRFLQDQEYRPLGAGKTCKADIRVIAASNADLEGAVRCGKFRSDLFYRLNILPLKLPALRDRREDIPLLARHFVSKYTREFSTSVKQLSRTALDKLLGYEWPGNIRELENVISRAIVLSEQSLILVDDICLSETPPSWEETSFKALKARAIREFETSYLRRLLVANDGNISKAARAAKKNRRAFWQLMRKHEIIAPAAH